MKLQHNGDTTPALDLTDEATLNELMNADVLKPSTDVEAEATETAIKELKPAKVTLTLSGAENAQITRMASVKNQSVKEFLLSKIQEMFLESNVGQPLITSPSNFSGTKVSGKKISAPTGMARRLS